MHYAVQSPQRKKMGRCSVYASFNSSLTARKTFAAECFFQVVVGVVRKLAKLQQNAEQSPVARNLITCSSARMRSDRHTNKPGQTHAHKHTHTYKKQPASTFQACPIFNRVSLEGPSERMMLAGAMQNYMDHLTGCF